jgi:hypothetical protein
MKGKYNFRQEALFSSREKTGLLISENTLSRFVRGATMWSLMSIFG